MPFIVSKGSSFVPCPAGPHSAVCVDVVDLGMVPNKFKNGQKQHRCRLVWQVAENNEEGKPFLVQKTYTASLHEKAILRKDLESWRGRPFSDQEAEGFDVEVLLLKPCLLNVQHNEKGGSVYADVTSIMRLPKGMAAVQMRGYVRVKDRSDDPQAHPDGGDYDYGTPVEDDPIPFAWVLPFLLPAAGAAHVLLSQVVTA